MNKNTTDTRKTEQALSHIGAEVADANELSDEISQLTEKQQEKPSAAQEEISELYENLGEEPEEKTDEKPDEAKTRH